MYLNPITAIDGYKVDHRRQYPDNTQVIFSNLTARKSRRGYTDQMVFFGLQYFIKHFLSLGRSMDKSLMPMILYQKVWFG